MGNKKVLSLHGQYRGYWRTDIVLREQFGSSTKVDDATCIDGTEMGSNAEHSR